MSPRSSRFNRKENYYHNYSPYGLPVNRNKFSHKQRFPKNRKNLNTNTPNKSWEPYGDRPYESAKQSSFLTNDMTKGLQVIVYQDEKEISMMAENSPRNTSIQSNNDNPFQSNETSLMNASQSFFRHVYSPSRSPNFANYCSKNSVPNYEPCSIHPRENTPEANSMSTGIDEMGVKPEIFTFPQPSLSEVWASGDTEDNRIPSKEQDVAIGTVLNSRNLNSLEVPSLKLTCDSSSQTREEEIEHSWEFPSYSKPLNEFRKGIMKVASDFEFSVRKEYNMEEERQPSKEDFAILRNELSALKNIVQNLHSVIVSRQTTDYTQANSRNS